MALRRVVVSAWCLLVTGCAVIGASANLPTGDTQHWTTYRIAVGDHVVRFTIPPDESPDWPEFEIPNGIDLNKPDSFNKLNRGPKLLARFWDYRTQRYGKVAGTLRAYIVLWRTERELTDVEALRAASDDNDLLEKAKEAMEGQRQAPNEMRYELAEIAGRKGYLVRQRISGSYYLAPVDLHHYVTIAVSTEVTKPGWREDSQAAVAAIMQSINIEPR